MSPPDPAPAPEQDGGSLALPDGSTIAYRRRAGTPPGIVFLGGFRSDMTGTKALFLDSHCAERGRAFVRFDYFGHGGSSGAFADGTIGRWTDDAVAVLDALTEGRQILVGSSMGAWIMLRAALARPERVAALVGIAAAPDFTEDLVWGRLDAAQRQVCREAGAITLPSAYDPQGYPYAYALIADGRQRLVLREAIALDRPVRLLHGLADEAVPWQTSLRLAERLTGPDVTLTLVKGGDHRLSTAPDLARLAATLDALARG